MQNTCRSEGQRTLDDGIQSSSKTSYDDKKQDYQPTLYNSEYTWKKAKDTSSEKGKVIWYRKMDGMANFVLHWQHRFHNHGDMYIHANLKVVDSKGIQSGDNNVTTLHLREAMRRMRSIHPITAISIQKRKDLNVDSVTLPKTLQHLQLQVCLAYQVPRTEQDVQDWLDQIITVHDPKEKERDFPTFFRKISNVNRSSVNHLKVHIWEAVGDLPSRIVVEQSHVVSDGIGLATTFDELTQCIASTLADPTTKSIEWGPEVVNLPPSLQDAIASPPETWQVTTKEKKIIERESRARMAGKAKPNTLDKGLDRVLEFTLANNASNSKLRRKLNWPLARIVRSVAQSGQVFPIGLLPNAKKPFNGPWTNTDYIEDDLSKSETKKLLAGLKKHKVTLAPFVEAAMAFATTWIRRQRGLTDEINQWDSSSKVIGSFSNAMSKRGELMPDQQRYLGLAMAGIVTKISASTATWSQESLQEAIPSSSDPLTKVPKGLNEKDTESLLNATNALAEQYNTGRQDVNWLKYHQATMFSAMQSEYLLLSNEAYYPSHPWLSSLGRLDANITRTKSIPSGKHLSLELDSLRMMGRVNIAQICCHIYSFDGEMIFTVSYPDWLYNTNDNGRRTKRHGVDYSKRANIVPIWYSIVKMILNTLIEDTL